MLQKGSGTAYEDDHSIYSTDSLKRWVEEFRSLHRSGRRPAGEGQGQHLRHGTRKFGFHGLCAQPRRERSDADQGYDRHGLHILQYEHLHGVQRFGQYDPPRLRHGDQHGCQVRHRRRQGRPRADHEPSDLRPDLRRGHGRRGNRHRSSTSPSSTRWKPRSSQATRAPRTSRRSP